MNTVSGKSVIATIVEVQSNFGRYLEIVQGANKVIVTRDGLEVGRFISHSAVVSYLTDSLTGILKSDTDTD